MNALELADNFDTLGRLNDWAQRAQAMLRQQEEELTNQMLRRKHLQDEIEQLKENLHNLTISSAKRILILEDDLNLAIDQLEKETNESSRFHDKCDEQDKEIEQLKQQHDFLEEHLKLWKDSGVPAPANELQSIQTWLKHLGQHGDLETRNVMRTRMLLLINAAQKLHEKGPEAEDKAGIYEHRPEMRPVEKESEK